MKCGIGIVFGAALQLFADEPIVKSFPLSIGAFQEAGIVKSGLYTVTRSTTSINVKDDWMDHFGAFIDKKAVVNDRLFLSAGLGGVFEYRKRELVRTGFTGSQRKGFFIGPANTEAVYHFGDPDKPWLKLGLGMFGYKYNPEAQNLGEYLFRSGAYPTYTITGGYTIIGSAGNQFQGFKAQMAKGNLRADLFFTTETSLAPLFDWSPSGVFSYSLGEGMLDLGFGINLKHLLQVKPSRSAQRSNINGYFTYKGKDYTANTDYYDSKIQFNKTHGITAQAVADSVEFALVDSLVRLPEGQKPKLSYYNSRSTLLMARATLDLKKLTGMGAMGSQDLKVYSEVGVLGVQNVPVFYKSISERMPIMVGINLPAFKLLDVFSLQVEYMNSPWMNNTYQIGANAANTPFFPIASDSIVSEKTYNDLATKDNLKWSVLLKKSLGPITFSAQAARDHLRVPSQLFYYGPQFDHNEVTVSNKDWYFMTQISWGI